jgi:hypothetical protein
MPARDTHRRPGDRTVVPRNTMRPSASTSTKHDALLEPAHTTKRRDPVPMTLCGRNGTVRRPRAHVCESPNTRVLRLTDDEVRGVGEALELRAQPPENVVGVDERLIRVRYGTVNNSETDAARRRDAAARARDAAARRRHRATHLPVKCR